MTDTHRHRWHTAAMAKGEPFAICKDEGCAMILAAYRIDRYLNAVECLSAPRLREILEDRTVTTGDIVAIRAYVKALEE